MGLINWHEPKQKSDPKAHARDHVFDGGPPGAYVPNMDKNDMYSWKGKMVGTRSGHPHVEIRYHPFLIIVSIKGGYKYKFYTRENTKDINVHVSTAGPIQLSFTKWEEFKDVVDEARDALRRWHDDRGQFMPDRET